MEQITSITDSPKQTFEVDLEDNKGSVQFYLYYLPTQYSWYYDFTYGDYTSNGNKVVLNPNALRHLRKIIPFGIMFTAQGNIEPYKQDDFSSDRVKMILLNEEEVLNLEEEIYDI